MTEEPGPGPDTGGGNDTGDAAPRSGLSGGLRALLVVSLALNLLIAGGVAGAWWMHRSGPAPDHARHAQGAGGPLTRALSPEDRRAIMRRMMAAHRDRTAETVQGADARRAALEALIVALRAEPFDRVAASAYMARQRAAMGMRLERAQAALLDRLEAMGAARRAAYADRLETALDARRVRSGRHRN